MDATVLICTYGRSAGLEATLESIRRLRTPDGFDWELIVVDNEMSTRTAEIVADFSHAVDFDVRLLQEPRAGKSYALNTGVSQALGRIVAFTDDDVTVHPDWLMELIRVFERQDCIGVGGRIVPEWTSPRPGWLSPDGEYRLMSAIVQFDQGDQTCELDVSPFGANVAYSRAAFDEYGRFRTDIGPAPDSLLRGEDTEFASRLMKAGEKLFYAPDAIVWHPVDPARATRRYLLRWYFDYGRSAVRKNGVPDDAVLLSGVPRFFFRALVEDGMRWMTSVRRTRRFYYKAKTYLIAGKIFEAYRQAKSETRSGIERSASLP